MTAADWGLLVAALSLGVVGLGFRLGRFRRLGWGYFDPEYRKNRFYRNGVFALPLGFLMFFVGFLAGFVDDGSWAGGILVLIAIGVLAVALVTFVRPAQFMKPQWIREIDNELNGDPRADLRRMEILRGIRPPLN
jgi:hypothetical protein